MKEKVVFKEPISLESGKGKEEDLFLESILSNMKDDAGFKESVDGLGEEDKELLKFLTSSVPGGPK